MTLDPRPPRTIATNVDANPRTPGDGAEDETAIFDVETFAAEIDPVVAERDAHRHREIARSAAEISVGHDRSARERLAALHRARAAAAHHVHAVDRLQRANQHRGRRTLPLGDDVHQRVDAVVEIHVGVPGPSVHRRIAGGRTRRGVTRRIGFSDVGLDLDDRAAGDHAAAVVDENFPDQIAGDVESASVVETSGQLHKER